MTRQRGDPEHTRNDQSATGAAHPHVRWYRAYRPPIATPFPNRVSYPRRMSEPEERDRPDGGGMVEGTDNESATGSDAAARAGHSDIDASDLSDTGVGLSVGEPNTFEPEEAGPAVESPKD